VLTFADVMILTDVSEGVGRSARVRTVRIPSSLSVVCLVCQQDIPHKWKIDMLQGPLVSQICCGFCTIAKPVPIMSGVGEFSVPVAIM